MRYRPKFFIMFLSITMLCCECRISARALTWVSGIGGDIHAIERKNDTVFIAQSDTIKIIDIHNIGKPRLVASYKLNGIVGSIGIKNDVMYISKGIYGSDYGEVQVYAIDKSVLKYIATVKPCDLTVRIPRLKVVNTLLFVDMGELSTSGAIYDIANPLDPKWIDNWRPNKSLGAAYDKAIRDRYNTSEKGLDSNILSAIRPFIDVRRANSVSVIGNAVCVLDGVRQVKIINAHEPGSIYVEHNIDLDTTYSKLCVNNNVIYLYGESRSVSIYQQGASGEFIRIAHICTSQEVRSIVFRGSRAVCLLSDGYVVYDVSNAAKPRVLSNNKANSLDCHDILIDDNYAYISANSFLIYQLISGALVSEIRQSHAFNTRQIEQVGNLIYSLGINSDGYEVNQIIGIKNPRKPLAVPMPDKHSSYYEQFHYLCRYRAYLSFALFHSSTGPRMYDLELYAPKAGLELLASYKNLQDVNDMSSDQKYIYVADGAGGLKIFEYVQ